MTFTLSFIQLFLWYSYLGAPLLLFLCLIIVILGQCVGCIEGWSKFDAFYWAFITATTVGYGDIRPLTKSSKILSIIITLTGMVLTGILVAIAVHTATVSFGKHIQPNIIVQSIL